MLSFSLRSLAVLAFMFGLASSVQAKGALPDYPTPQTVSKELQKYITLTPLFAPWNAHPKNAEEWRALVSAIAKQSEPLIAPVRQKLGVESKAATMAGVPVYILSPKDIAPAHKGRVLLHIHGGGYVFNPGISGTHEGILMAGFGKIQVISVDYRMAPDHPYPAALDDVFTVYKELLKTYKASSIGVFGSSTGGALTLALTLKAKAEGLPLPAALAPGTPWSDIAKIGDTYFTHEGQDNILVTYDGWLKGACEIYANGHDLKDPYLSPIYGDVSGFPPVFLTSGTRDLFLSNTVRMHLALRKAKVPAELMVFEGMSHVTYQIDPDVPEVQMHFAELTQFFDRNFR